MISVFVFRPFASMYRKNNTSKIRFFSAHVATCGQGLVVWWRCGALCTSCFVDDVVLGLHNAEK